MLRLRIARVDEIGGPDDGETAPAWLGAAERQRWTTLGAARRREFAAGRRLLRDTLAQATGLPAEDWAISAAVGAAPVVQGPASVRASLSHRLGWVAAAVSDGAVGIDVEPARPPRSDAAGRAALMLAPAELVAWNALARGLREAALRTAWTAKEAWFKASPPHTTAWDFRRVVARACAPADANVRVWEASPLHVAVCSVDAGELARVECAGLGSIVATSTFWHVARAGAPA